MRYDTSKHYIDTRAMIFIPDPHPFTLKENTLHLWHFSLQEDLPMDVLNEEEIKRAKRYYFKHHQRRFATARTKLRQILGQYLSIAPSDIQFVTSTYGKPEVNNPLHLHFNLSHSGDYGLLGITQHHPLGIDIEKHAARPYHGIAKHSFSEEEIQALKTTHPSNVPALFFHIWSQKEAFIKACGLGLSYPIKSFTVPTTLCNPSLIEDKIHHETWQIQAFMYAISISAAFCCAPDIHTFYINTY